MSDKKAESKEKPLEKMTVKALREMAKEIPEISGVHGMKKEELIVAINEVRGAKEETAKEETAKKLPKRKPPKRKLPKRKLPKQKPSKPIKAAKQSRPLKKQVPTAGQSRPR
jgi:hypothetical protein